MKHVPICGLFGRRGVGKTSLARAVSRHQPRVVVWDYLGEYGPLALRSEGNLSALDDYLTWAERHRFAAARYIPENGGTDEFEEVCALVYGYENLLFVVEEAAVVCQASYLPPQFGRIVRQGRHRGIGLLWTTQRLNEVSRTLTGLTDAWAGFHLSEPADLTALAARCGRGYAESIAALPRFGWLGYDVDSQGTFDDIDRLKALWGAPKTWSLHNAVTGLRTGSVGTGT